MVAARVCLPCAGLLGWFWRATACPSQWLGDANALLQSHAGRVDERETPKDDVALTGLSAATQRSSVLVFIAVGNSGTTMSRLMRGVEHMNKHSKELDWHLFLAHYHPKQVWLDLHAQWYTKSVDFSAEATGYKMQLAQQVLPSHLANHAYDWVWLLDEDVDFSATDLTRLFHTAAESGALISQPALQGVPLESVLARLAQLQGAAHRPVSQLQLAQQVSTGVGCQLGEAMCQHLVQHPCLFRFTNLVEVMAPIMRPDTLLLILEKCDHCLHERSVWGLDKMWCKWTAKQLNVEANRSCAVLDVATVEHTNQKTLGKWTPTGQRQMDVVHMSWDAMHDVEARYPDEFIADFGTTLSCIQR